jgi:hypothetical protein
MDLRQCTMRSYPKLIDRFPYLTRNAIEGEPVRTKSYPKLIDRFPCLTRNAIEGEPVRTKEPVRTRNPVETFDCPVPLPTPQCY